MLCISCSGEMRIVRIEQDAGMKAAGYEHQRFECVRCQKTERRLAFSGDRASLPLEYRWALGLVVPGLPGPARTPPPLFDPLVVAAQQHPRRDRLRRRRRDGPVTSDGREAPTPFRLGPHPCAPSIICPAAKPVAAQQRVVAEPRPADRQRGPVAFDSTQSAALVYLPLDDEQPKRFAV